MKNNNKEQKSKLKPLQEKPIKESNKVKRKPQNKIEYKTLWIHKDVHDEITKEGRKGETYDDIVIRILKVYRKYKNVYEKENTKQ